MQQRFNSNPNAWDNEFQGEADGIFNPDPDAENGNDEGIPDVMVNNNQQAECAICMGPRGHVKKVLNPCGHARFCEPCLETQMGIRRNCPICRERVQSIITLFD